MCESLVVTEYLAEVHSSALLPKQPNDRAIMRLFDELCGSTFSYFPLLRAIGDDAKFDSEMKTFREGLVNINAFLTHKAANQDDSPFLLDDFSLAECNIAPFVHRCCAILPGFTGRDGIPLVDPLELCEELELPRLKQWIQAILSRPAVIKTTVPKEEIIVGATRMLERFAAMSK